MGRQPSGERVSWRWSRWRRRSLPGVGAGRPPREAGDQTSLASRRLRQGADFVQRFGRGPLADWLRQRPITSVTWTQQPPQPDQHHG
jgi:hypothetical protein